MTSRYGVMYSMVHVETRALNWTILWCIAHREIKFRDVLKSVVYTIVYTSLRQIFCEYIVRENFHYI